jgi:hypothetical protein
MVVDILCRHALRKRGIQYSEPLRRGLLIVDDYWIARIGERSDAVLRAAVRGQ